MIRTWLLIVGALATLGFATIVLLVLPQVVVQEITPPEQLAGYTESEEYGRYVYQREGCYYCHSQQVRDPTFTSDVERGWGTRATVPADYVYDAPHLLGTMRTGPDLINAGQRLPDPDWHLLHFYQPRALNEWSIMPAYKYLFETKLPSQVLPNDRVVDVPDAWRPEGRVVVATRDVLALTDYIISLRRLYPVPSIENPPPPGEAGAVGGAAAAAAAAPSGNGRSMATMP